MKIIYKSLMTIAFAGLSLASCDKELKEETAMEVGVVTDSNVSFNGNTVTVKKGSPVTFSFNGDPDFITFFSGEIGHEYKHRNRTEMKVEVLKSVNLVSAFGIDMETQAQLKALLMYSFPTNLMA